MQISRSVTSCEHWFIIGYGVVEITISHGEHGERSECVHDAPPRLHLPALLAAGGHHASPTTHVVACSPSKSVII